MKTVNGNVPNTSDLGSPLPMLPPPDTDGDLVHEGNLVQISTATELSFYRIPNENIVNLYLFQMKCSLGLLMSSLLPQSLCHAGHLIYVLICQLSPVVLSPLDCCLLPSMVAFPIPMGGTAKHKPALYCIAASIRSQQESLSHPVLKINWALLNAILNKMLIKL